MFLNTGITTEIEWFLFYINLSFGNALVIMSAEFQYWRSYGLLLQNNTFYHKAEIWRTKMTSVHIYQKIGLIAQGFFFFFLPISGS